MPSTPKSVTRSAVFLVIGLGGLRAGARWILDGAVVIASKMDIRESIIGLTIVAMGTSLPELATAAVAAYKKNPDIAVGNVVGPNNFNIFYNTLFQQIGRAGRP